MNRLALGILATMGAMVVGVEQAFPGWEIDVQYRGTVVIRERHVFEGHRYKEENVDEKGRLTTVTIFDLDVERLTVVRHSARTYFSATFREWDERQRADDAQLIRSQRKQLNRMSAVDREVWKQRTEAERLEYCQIGWTVQPTDRSETIAGYRAIRYDVLVNGRSFAQIWLAKEFDPLQHLTPAMRERLAVFARTKEPSIGPALFAPHSVSGPAAGFMRQDCQAGEPGATVDLSWRLLEQGYEMRRELGVTSEVIRIRQKEFPASEFLPPRGFVRKPLREY
jgi:hypothetical protein